MFLFQECFLMFPDQKLRAAVTTIHRKQLRRIRLRPDEASQPCYLRTMSDRLHYRRREIMYAENYNFADLRLGLTLDVEFYQASPRIVINDKGPHSKWNEEKQAISLRDC